MQRRADQDGWRRNAAYFAGEYSGWMEREGEEGPEAASDVYCTCWTKSGTSRTFICFPPHIPPPVVRMKYLTRFGRLELLCLLRESARFIRFAGNTTLSSVKTIRTTSSKCPCIARLPSVKNLVPSMPHSPRVS